MMGAGPSWGLPHMGAVRMAEAVADSGLTQTQVGPPGPPRFASYVTSSKLLHLASQSVNPSNGDNTSQVLG